MTSWIPEPSWQACAWAGGFPTDATHVVYVSSSRVFAGCFGLHVGGLGCFLLTAGAAKASRQACAGAAGMSWNPRTGCFPPAAKGGVIRKIKAQDTSDCHDYTLRCKSVEFHRQVREKRAGRRGAGSFGCAHGHEGPLADAVVIVDATPVAQIGVRAGRSQMRLKV